MMKKRTRVKLLCFLFSTFLLAGSILPSFTSAAAGDCEEWYARTGLIDKSGDNENGYTIGSRGDSGYSLARLDNKFDVLATEIQFSFKAYPTDGVSNEIWAYMSFGLDFDDRKILHTADENRRIRVLLSLFFGREPEAVLTFPCSTIMNMLLSA